MATLSKMPKFQPLDAEGNPYPSYRVFSYEAGTSTPLVTYKDRNNTPNTNPVILDSAGMADIWLEGAYKLVLRPPAGHPDELIPIWTVDNIEEYDQLDWTGLTATIAELNATDTSTKNIYDNYDVLLTDRGKTLLCDTSATAFNVNLPLVSVATNGYILTIKKTSTLDNAVTINPQTGEKIEGLDKLLLNNKDETIILICDGSNWRIKADTANIRIYEKVIDNTTGDLSSLQTYPPRYFVRVEPSTSDIEVKLPPLSTIGNGLELIIKKIGKSESSVKITPDGIDEIDDEQGSIFIHSQNESIGLLSTADSWYKISDSAGISRGDIQLGNLMFLTNDAYDIPPDYMVADGREISRTDYAEYFALVGTTWGSGNGSTTFNIPNVNGYTVMSSGANSNFNVTSLTRAGNVVTAVTSGTHNYPVLQYIKISGADQTEYNGIWQIASVPAANQFTYNIDTTPVTPATGTITVYGIYNNVVIPSGGGSLYIGRSDGVWEETLGVNNIPSHNHLYTNRTGDGEYCQGGGATHVAEETQGTSYTGGGQPFFVIQPTKTIRILVKVK